VDLFNDLVNIRKKIIKKFMYDSNLDEKEFNEKMKEYKKKHPKNLDIIWLQTSLRKELTRFNQMILFQSLKI